MGDYNFEQNLQNGYKMAYENACAQLAQRDDPKKIADNSWSVFNENKSLFKIKYLNEFYNVGYPDGKVSFDGRSGDVPVASKIVILHYLLTVNQEALTGNLISFKEIPGGMIYLKAFEGRVLGGFIARFGKNAALLEMVAEKVGGRMAKYGHAALTLDILPKLPITYVIWEGDEEVKPNGTILFDSSAPNCLPTEDLVVACAAGASLLKISLN